MKLRHLGLPVADTDRSLQFYATWFDLDPATAVESHGEEETVSFRCLDPDGWRIEVCWESSPVG